MKSGLSINETFTRMTNLDCSEQSTVCVVKAKHSKRVINNMVNPFGTPIIRVREYVARVSEWCKAHTVTRNVAVIGSNPNSEQTQQSRWLRICILPKQSSLLLLQRRSSWSPKWHAMILLTMYFMVRIAGVTLDPLSLTFMTCFLISSTREEDSLVACTLTST